MLWVFLYTVIGILYFSIRLSVRRKDIRLDDGAGFAVFVMVIVVIAAWPIFCAWKVIKSIVT